jgi:hypothetical protein
MDDERRERKIIAALLGEVTKPKATGGFVITPDVLDVPLQYEGSVVRCFCLGCGESVELIPLGAEALAKRAKAPVPSSWEGYYFTVKRCIVCERKFRYVVLHRKRRERLSRHGTE